MEEYEACVELSVKTHNRKVRYYRKKHEAELEAEKEQEELEAAEQQNAEGGSAQQGNPTPQF